MHSRLCSRQYPKCQHTVGVQLTSQRRHLGAGCLAESPSVGMGDEDGGGWEQQHGGLYQAGEWSWVGKQSAVVLFIGLCCHPVDIYLYWLLPAASSLWRSGSGTGPVGSSIPASLSRLRLTSPAARTTYRQPFPMHVRGVPAFPTTAFKAQASLRLTTVLAACVRPKVSVPDSTLGGRCCHCLHCAVEKTSSNGFGKCCALSILEKHLQQLVESRQALWEMLD